MRDSSRYLLHWLKINLHICIVNVNGTCGFTFHDFFESVYPYASTNLIGVAVVENGNTISLRKNNVFCELAFKSFLYPFNAILRFLYILNRKKILVQDSHTDHLCLRKGDTLKSYEIVGLEFKFVHHLLLIPLHFTHPLWQLSNTDRRRELLYGAIGAILIRCETELQRLLNVLSDYLSHYNR